MFHYLEGPDQPNPYDDDYSRQHPGKVPWLRRLSEEAMAQENVDTPDEIEWGKSMSEIRNIFLQKLVKSIDKEKRAKAAASASKGIIIGQELILSIS
jgi:Ino eighty subunit 1